jgi:hypothetical protein
MDFFFSNAMLLVIDSENIITHFCNLLPRILVFFLCIRMCTTKKKRDMRVNTVLIFFSLRSSMFCIYLSRRHYSLVFMGKKENLFIPRVTWSNSTCIVKINPIITAMSFKVYQQSKNRIKTIELHYLFR